MAIWFADYTKFDLNQGYLGLDKHCLLYTSPSPRDV